MKNIKSNIQGFTLIEVTIVVAIVGIVSAIAIAGYISWKPGNVFRAAVSQVQNDLNRAKMRAVQTRRQCQVVFSTNGYEIQDGNLVMRSTAWGTIDPNGTFTAGVPFSDIDFSNLPQITVTNDDGSAIVAGSLPTIRFSPRGTALTLIDSPSVVHPDAGSADFAVNITGRINITWE